MHALQQLAHPSTSLAVEQPAPTTQVHVLQARLKKKFRIYIIYFKNTLTA